MALPVSSLSIVCNEILDFVRAGLNASSNNISVTIGAPAEVPDSDEEHRVNLFFYRFEPSAFQTAAFSNDPWRLRMFCLITAFGVLDDSVSAGENELRMLGEIMRIFREQPISNPTTVGSEQVRLQTIFSPATDEQVNQVWSTQGDTSYRPSVIYEMALAPIMPSVLRSDPPLVGGFGTESRAAAAGRYAGFTGSEHAPVVPAHYINVADPHWAPQLCWVYLDACHHTLALDVDAAGFATFEPQIWLAGDPSTSVNLVWQVWNNSGWSTVSPAVSATPVGTAIDPENIPAAVPGSFPFNLTLPIALAAGETGAQALLYAERSVIPYAGADPVQIRSNPLLISLYRVLP